MALTESFNKFAGKVINCGELRQELAKAGFYLDTQPASAQFLKKINNQDSETLDLIKTLSESQYMTSQTAKEIEQEVLNCSDPESAIATLQVTTAKHANGLYVEAVSTLKMASSCYDDKAFVKAYIKAVDACADHKDKVGKDTVELQTAAQEIIQKVVTKFGL